MGAGHRYRISRLPGLWRLTDDDYGGSGKAASAALVHREAFTDLKTATAQNPIACCGVRRERRDIVIRFRYSERFWLAPAK